MSFTSIKSLDGIYGQAQPRYRKMPPFPHQYAVYGSDVDGLYLYIHEDTTRVLTNIELGCSAMSDINRAIYFVINLWIDGRMAYEDKRYCDFLDTPIPEDEDSDEAYVYCEKTDAECRDVVKEDIFHERWNPMLRRFTSVDNLEGLFVVSTPVDNFREFTVPTIVINPRTQKATLVTDLQELELQQRYPNITDIKIEKEMKR